MESVNHQTTQREQSRLKKIRSGPRMLILTLAVVFAVAVYYVGQHALRYLYLDQAYYQHHWSHAIWLIIHISGGIVALILGPFQFLSGLRGSYVRIHRMIGRLYIGSIGVSAMAAIYILMIPESSFGFRIGIAGLALAWITTTGLAFIAILRKNIIQHKEWMIRSYVVTFGFVMFRFLLDGMNFLKIGTIEERVSAVSWMCWAIPLLICELILQGRKIFLSPKKQPKNKKIIF